MRQFSIRSITILLLPLWLLVACDDKSDSLSESDANAMPTEAVTFQLSWFFDYAATPFYLAETKGYFANNGLTVTMQQGGFDAEGHFIDPVPVLLSGEAEFITLDLPSLLQAQQAGHQLVAIAAVTQRSPYVLIALPESGIVRPQDMVGKTVAVSDGGARTLLEALLTGQDIALTEVNIISRTDFGVDTLLNGEVDVLAGWIVNEGLLVQSAGITPNYMLFTDYGINTYDFLIVTTAQTIAERHEMVQHFVDSFVAGGKEMIADPQAAAELTMKYNDTLIVEDQLAHIHLFIPLVNPAGSHIGALDPSVFELGQALLLENGILTAPLDLTQVYTLEFLQE